MPVSRSALATLLAWVGVSMFMRRSACVSSSLLGVYPALPKPLAVCLEGVSLKLTSACCRAHARASGCLGL